MLFFVLLLISNGHNQFQTEEAFINDVTQIWRFSDPPPPSCHS